MDARDNESRSGSARRASDESDRLRGEALFIHSDDAIVDVDPAGVITAFNSAAERLFARRARDVIGSSVDVLVPERPPAEVAELLADLASRRDVTPYVSTFRLPGGDIVHLSVTAVPLVHADGSAGGLTVMLRDRTALLRTQELLATNEARYRTMVEFAHEGIAVLDARQRFTFVNTRLAEMFGYTVEEMSSLSLADITFPEDERDLAAMIERRRQGMSEDAENRWRRKDGTPIWTMKATTPLLDEAGVFTGSVSFLADVTDRRRSAAALLESEARLRSYFEYVPVGIMLVSADSLIQEVNPAFCSITGYERDELLGVSLHALLGADYRAQMAKNALGFTALLAGEIPSMEFERPLVTKQGRSIWLAVTVSLLRNDDDKPFEFVAVIQDITSRKDAERVKDEFISVTSHELRTPLTSIRGALGLLSAGVVGNLPDSAQRMLDVAVQSTDRLIRLINDILDLERLSSGKLSLSLKACDAAGLVSRAVEEIRGSADASEVQVRAAALEGRVWADEDRVIQILTNLISNAIKFSPPFSTVEVSSEVEGDHVSFAVADHGTGIPGDLLETVFERFRQVDASDSRVKGGTGLGLAICRAMVEQHGGRIWADSALGAGTTFTFTLPLATDIGEEILPDDRCQPAVLVCDDDAATCEVLKATLEAGGYRVWTAANGEEALAVARIHQPDVIVLDPPLPGTDAGDTADTLRSQTDTAGIPLIVLSVLNGEQMGIGGAAGPTENSLDEDMLLAALRNALRGERRQALIVEDDPHLAEVLGMALARHDLEVRHARTGSDAMRLSGAVVPDLVVLDLALPDGDGYSVVEWMREQRLLGTVPVLVYTAFDLDDADRNRLRLGETKFLTKGRTTPELFEAKLQELLDWIEKQAPQK